MTTNQPTQSFRAMDANEPTEKPDRALTTPDPFCTGQCSVCDSGFVDKINSLRHQYTLLGLSEYIKNEYGLEFSKDQLHRHFKKYALKMRDESLALAYQSFRIESAHVAEHQKQVLFLASFTFEEILRRITNGTLQVGVDEFEKMLKLYYQILRDPDGAQTPDITEIYMRAVKKYRVPLNHQSFDFAQGGQSVPQAQVVNDAQQEPVRE